MCQRRERQHKGLTDSRSEKGIVQRGLTSSSTNHVLARTAVTEEAGFSLTLPSNHETPKIINADDQQISLTNFFPA